MLEQRGGAHDAGERIAQIMAEHADEQIAHALGLLDLIQLPSELLLLAMELREHLDLGEQELRVEGA